MEYNSSHQVSWENRQRETFLHGVIKSGTKDDDLILGTKEEDFLLGGAGNDIIISGEGEDGIHGGSGYDIAVLPGKQSDYELEVRGKKVNLASKNGDKTLVGIEIINFLEDKKYVNAMDFIGDSQPNSNKD